ncbi:hypothetical protein OKW43_000023 [Paraburkholderia sp. WC7.3g]|uniref:hypothetical protein n=1 Tax=Paraburkholderia sp. WC7.3g TaxID=2991070 RepID=UPI003D1EDF40
MPNINQPEASEPSEAFEQWASEEGINNFHFNHCWAAWQAALATVAPLPHSAATVSDDSYPARLLHESDESLAWRVDSWHQRNARAASTQATVTDREPDREVIEPLKEPVYINKALLGGRNAHVVRSGGTGPMCAVFLVNIQLTGWSIETEWADGYAKGFNQAAAWMQDAILPRASEQADEAVTDQAKLAERFLGEQDAAQLFVFHSQLEDSDADGYTVRKETMKRLAELGVVNSLGFGKYSTTAFGVWLVESTFEQNPSLPLRTVEEHNTRAKEPK